MTAQLPSINEKIYRLANHIAGAKGGLPAEWQDWAEEIETDLRALLAAYEQEPSEYLTHVIDDGYGEFSDKMNFSLPVGTKLYTHPAPSGTNQVDELVMWVKRLSHSLKKANPDSKLHFEAMDYLKRNALIGITDVLRSDNPAPVPAVPKTISVRTAIAALDNAESVTTLAQAYKMGWNACCSAMLNGGKS